MCVCVYYVRVLCENVCAGVYGYGVNEIYNDKEQSMFQEVYLQLRGGLAYMYE